MIIDNLTIYNLLFPHTEERRLKRTNGTLITLYLCVMKRKSKKVRNYFAGNKLFHTFDPVEGTHVRKNAKKFAFLLTYSYLCIDKQNSNSFS